MFPRETLSWTTKLTFLWNYKLCNQDPLWWLFSVSLIGLFELLKHENYCTRISDTIKSHQKLRNDQHSFYLTNKWTKWFKKYWSLSLAYTNVSIINLIRSIIEDSNIVSNFFTIDFRNEIIDIYGEPFDDYLELFIGFIAWDDQPYEDDCTIEKENFLNQNISTKQLFNALLQDIRSTGIDPDIFNYFIVFRNYEENGEARTGDLSDLYSSKRDILDQLYCYFSQIKDIKSYNKNWTNNCDFKVLEANNFKHRIYYDPFINPRIIGMTIYDLWSKEFTIKANERLAENANKLYSTDKPPIPPWHWLGWYLDF